MLFLTGTMDIVFLELLLLSNAILLQASLLLILLGRIALTNSMYDNLASPSLSNLLSIARISSSYKCSPFFLINEFI